jgi:hypothetical protein
MNQIKTSEVRPNGTAGEFQSDSKLELLKTNQKKELVTITGTLTSRIEKREKAQETYYYGFFKLENQTPETPVIFKIRVCQFHSHCLENCRYKKEGKPNIAQGSEVELEGQ